MGLTRRTFLQWLGGAAALVGVSKVTVQGADAPAPETDPKAYGELMAELEGDRRVVGINVGCDMHSNYCRVDLHARNGKVEETWRTRETIAGERFREQGRSEPIICCYAGESYKDPAAALQAAVDKWHEDMA